MFRGARRSDLEQILEIYAHARKAMADSGNPTQWGDSYPPQEMLEEDIDSNRLFVYTVNGRLEAVFAFILGPAPPTRKSKTDSGSTMRCLTAPSTGWPRRVTAGAWRLRSSHGASSTARACGPTPTPTTGSCSIFSRRTVLPAAASSMWKTARPASPIRSCRPPYTCRKNKEGLA